MSTTMLLLLLSVVQVVYMKTYIIQKLELMRHSLDNSSQGNMSTTMLLLLLSVVQVVYMKTYIIETKLNAGSDEQGYGQDNDMDYGWNSGNANVNINNPAPVPAPAVLPPCKLTGWSAWKNEKPCGKTVKSRSRDCKRGSDQCEASECNGDLLKTVDITLGPCCSWAAWGTWSKPADKCVPSKVLRKRKCTKAVPGYYVSCGVEVKCKGLASEEKTVSENCCKWSEWTVGACSKTCGPGVQQKTRKCGYKNGSCSNKKCGGGTHRDTLECNVKQCPINPSIGSGGSNPGSGGSNPGSGGSNPGNGGTNTGIGGSNTGIGSNININNGGSNTGSGGSNTGNGGSNTGSGGSNTGSGSNININEGSNSGSGASNLASGGLADIFDIFDSKDVFGSEDVFGSKGVFGSEDVFGGGNTNINGGSITGIGGSNTGIGGSNTGIGGSNTGSGGYKAPKWKHR